MDRNGVIGYKGKLPWQGQLPSELKWFKQTTMGQVVIMGRKTHESIDKPLSGRFNIVLSRQSGLVIPGVVVLENLQKAIALASTLLPDKKIFILGGVQVFKEAMHLADTIYLTKINHSFEDNAYKDSAYFPQIDLDSWSVVNQEQFKASGNDLFDWTINIFERNFVCLKSARDPEYRQILEEIKKAKICPFCPQHIEKWHKAPILKKVGDWIITAASLQNYDEVKYRFLLIGERHIEKFEQLEWRDFNDISYLVKWTVDKYALKGYGLTVRSGSMITTGASVSHLHFHLIVPEDNKVVQFPIG